MHAGGVREHRVEEGERRDGGAVRIARVREPAMMSQQGRTCRPPWRVSAWLFTRPSSPMSAVGGEGGSSSAWFEADDAHGMRPVPEWSPCRLRPRPRAPLRWPPLPPDPPLDPPGADGGGPRTDRGGRTVTARWVQWLPHSGGGGVHRTRPGRHPGTRSTVQRGFRCRHGRATRVTHRFAGTGQRCAEILEQERHPGQEARPPVAQHTGRIECGGLCAASVEQLGDHRVETARRLDPGDRGVE